MDKRITKMSVEEFRQMLKTRRTKLLEFYKTNNRRHEPRGKTKRHNNFGGKIMF